MSTCTCTSEPLLCRTLRGAPVARGGARQRKARAQGSANAGGGRGVCVLGEAETTVLGGEVCVCVEEEGPWSGEGGGGPGGGVRAPVREKELRPSPLSGGGGQVGVPDPAAADGAAADGQAQVRAGGGGRVVHELLLNELRTPIAGVCVWWGRGTRGLEDRREAAQELLFAAQAAQEPLLDDLPWRRGRRGRGTAGGGGRGQAARSMVAALRPKCLPP